MSQIERIKLALEQNPRVSIFNVEDIDRRNDLHKLTYTNISRTTNFKIVPKIGFGVDDNLALNLQNFMDNLNVDLVPYKQENFNQNRIKIKRGNEEKEVILLKTGALYFNETFPGEIETLVRIQNKEFRRLDSIQFRGETIITPLPNVEIAEKYRFTSYMGYIQLDLRKN